MKSLSSSNKNLLKILKTINSTKNLYQWLLIMFNGVDNRRVKDVGPDRACAEWLLRNGASVKLKGAKEYLKNYNFLPEEKQQFYLQHIDATDSAIHHYGFKHFSNCKYIEEIKLVRCGYIKNDALPLLSLIKDSLKMLEIMECKNVTDEGLLHLKNLTNLVTLRIGGMPYIKNESHIISELTAALPSAYEYVVPAKGKQLIKTDLQFAVPEGTYGRVAPRSGLALKNFLDVGAGVVDADYRGEVGVLLFNHSDSEFIVKPGDRVAQFICEKIAYPELEEVKSLDVTARGAGGFGSTGIN